MHITDEDALKIVRVLDWFDKYGKVLEVHLLAQCVKLTEEENQILRQFRDEQINRRA